MSREVLILVELFRRRSRLLRKGDFAPELLNGLNKEIERAEQAWREYLAFLQKP